MSHPKKPRDKTHLTPMGDVLQGLLQNGKFGLANGFSRWRLEQNWPAIVGETIAEQTVPCAFENGTLYIWVRHSTWLQQLWFFQKSICQKVNAHVGYEWAQKVHFTLNRRAAGPEAGAGSDSGSGSHRTSSSLSDDEFGS